MGRREVDRLTEIIKASAERVTTREVIDAERKVIEAARALVHEDIDAKRYWRLRDSLRAAVEALDALEKP